MCPTYPSLSALISSRQSAGGSAPHRVAHAILPQSSRAHKKIAAVVGDPCKIRNPLCQGCDLRLNSIMFTGIVEETGCVESVKPTANAIELVVRARVSGRGVKTGDSVAVNGCCLTTTRVSTKGKDKLLRFELLAETWKRTNLQFVKAGSGVNLERPLRADGQLGGHFVTGHIDGLGKIARWEMVGKDHVLDISAPPEIMRYMIFKGSVAVDGISLTVAEARKTGFRIWIIPHTFEVTALRERKVGDAVNLEADLLGKFVDRFLSLKNSSRRASLI